MQRGLPIRLLARHFEKDGEQWRIAADVRQRVRWRRINLIAGLRQIGRFDVVFCRYVLGHMTDEAQRKVIDDLACVVPDDGYLVLGVKEQVAGMGARLPARGRPPRPLPPQPHLRRRGRLAAPAWASAPASLRRDQSVD